MMWLTTDFSFKSFNQPSFDPSVSLNDAVVVKVLLGAVVVLKTLTKNISLYVRGFACRRTSIDKICMIIHNANIIFGSVRSATRHQKGSPMNFKTNPIDFKLPI